MMDDLSLSKIPAECVFSNDDMLKLGLIGSWMCLNPYVSSAQGQTTAPEWVCRSNKLSSVFSKTLKAPRYITALYSIEIGEVVDSNFSAIAAFYLTLRRRYLRFEMFCWIVALPTKSYWLISILKRTLVIQSFFAALFTNEYDNFVFIHGVTI